MSKSTKKSRNFHDLRKRAEAMLGKSEESISDMSNEDIKRLVHELDTHQIELELQNEDLKKAYILLEETKKTYHELFDFAPCGYLKLDEKCMIMEVNLTATELLETVKSELINRKFTDFIVNEYQDVFYKTYSGNNDFNVKKSCELKLKRGEKDFWTNLELRHLKSTGSDNFSFLITINDISRQKYHQFFNNLTRNINDAIFFINPDDSKFIDINEQAANSLGYKRDELLSMGVVDIEVVIPDSFSWKKHVEEVHQKGSLLLEGLHKRKDGTVFPVEVNITATNYSNREYIIAIARDISERKKNELALNAEKAYSEGILNSMADGLWVLNDKGVTANINPAMAMMLGYSQEELIKMTPMQTTPAEYAENTKRIINEVFKGNVASGEQEIIKKDNSRVPVSILATPIKNQNNVITGAVAAIRDITEMKNAEKLVINSQKMEAVGSLASGMAHEFNNIIGIMIGYAQILLDNGDLTAEQRESIDLIYKNGKKAAGIIENVLKFSRKENIEMELFDLEKLLKDTIKIINLLLPPNIKIFCYCESDLPLIRGNKTQIQQALINISNNSIQAMGKKKGTLKLTLELEKGNSYQNISIPGLYLKLCIEDEGSGISDQIISRIFDPFFSTKEPGKGTGLGLSVVHGIVKTHNGEISLKSTPNVGTEICMYFPIALEETTVSKKVLKTLLHGVEHILIVEDEVALLNVLNKTLSKLGYRITTALNGIEAFEKIRNSSDRIDLVISDYAMPEMNGIELYEKIENIRKGIPFIIVTGYRNSELKKLINEKENIKYLSKPVNMPELTKLIRSYF